VPSDEAVVVEHNWNEVRTCMWDYVGIVRTDKRLDRALRRISNLRREIREYYLDYLVTPDVLELRNIAAVAELVDPLRPAAKESRGLHYTLDYPGTGCPRPRTRSCTTRPANRSTCLTDAPERVGDWVSHRLPCAEIHLPQLNSVPSRGGLPVAMRRTFSRVTRAISASASLVKNA
jgi:hypothetical protein